MLYTLPHFNHTCFDKGAHTSGEFYDFRRRSAAWFEASKVGSPIQQKSKSGHELALGASLSWNYL